MLSAEILLCIVEQTYVHLFINTLQIGDYYFAKLLVTLILKRMTIPNAHS